MLVNFERRLTHLPVKQNAPQLPDEVVLQVKDGAEVIEARDIDDLAAQVRRKFPDDTCERFLRHERDRETEKRKAEAMHLLVELLAEAALDDLLHEQAGLEEKPSRRES